MYKKYWKGAILMIVVVFLCVMNMKADYHGIVHNKSSNSFYIAPLHINPEVDYIFPKVYITKETKIRGKKELKDGQEIKVWVKKRQKQLIAKKIKIIE